MPVIFHSSNLKAILIVSITLLLTACGGRKTVATQDDSAEYRSALELPPLKKPSVEPSAGPVNSSSPSVDSITTRIEERSKKTAYLIVETEPDAAWEFLRELLKDSDITVHARNRDARQFVVGCAGIDDSEVTSNSKQRGWPVLRRNKDNETVYCALKLDERKSSVTVKVLNRKGENVPGDVARRLFSRLLPVN